MATIQSVKRALDILDLLAAKALRGEGAALQEIADMLGVNASTAHNIVKTMLDCGYLSREKTRGYIMGPKWSDASRMARFSEESIGKMAIVMNSLAQTTGESLVLAVLLRGERHPIIRVEGHEVIRVNPTFEDNNPIFNVVTGRVLAAFATPAELEQIVEVSGLPGELWKGINTRERLLKALEKIRLAGYAEECQEEMEIVALAVPVLSREENLICALGTFLPIARADRQRLSEILSNMQEAAMQLAQI